MCSQAQGAPLPRQAPEGPSEATAGLEGGRGKGSGCQDNTLPLRPLHLAVGAAASQELNVLVAAVPRVLVNLLVPLGMPGWLSLVL